MEDTGVKYMGRLGGSQGTIQLSLDALKEKKSSVDQVRRLSDSVPIYDGVPSSTPQKRGEEGEDRDITGYFRSSMEARGDGLRRAAKPAS